MIFYKLLHLLTLVVLVLFLSLAVVLTAKQAVPFLTDKYLADYNVTYSKIEGRLISGVTLYDLEYASSVKAKKLEIEYMFLNLLKPQPEIAKLTADGLFIDLEKLTQVSGEDTNSSSILFCVQNIELRNSQIVYERENYDFNLKTSELFFDESLDIKHLVLELQSPYTDLSLDGRIKQNKLTADSVLNLSDTTQKEYLHFLSKVPNPFIVKLQADLEKALLETKIESLSLKSDEDVNLEDISLKLNYENKSLTLVALYDVLYPDYALKVKQNVAIKSDSKYDSNLNIEIEKTPFLLPFKNLEVELSGDAKSVAGRVDAKNIKLDFKSEDYEEFSLNAKGDEVALSFVKNLPVEFNKDRLFFNSQATLKTNPFYLKGTLELEDDYFKTQTDFSYDFNATDINSRVALKEGSSLYKDYPIENFFPLELQYLQKNTQANLALTAKNLNLLVEKEGNQIEGFAKLRSTEFVVKGKVEQNSSLVELKTKIVSLKELLNEFNIDDERFKYDGEITLKSSLKIDESFSALTKVKIPEYSLIIDERDIHTFEEIGLDLSYENKSVRLESYKLKYKEHAIYSHKPSKIFFDKNGSIRLKELWINDSLLVKGVIALEEQKVDLSITSELVTFDSKEANISAKVDLKVKLDGDNEYIEGDITLLEGEIYYMPQNDYSIVDKDIIIIQDIKEERETNRYMNLNISSQKAIRYKHKNINILFKPNLNLVQEPHKELALYGLVELKKGKIFGGGKKFTLDHSEVYFSGEEYMNPQLNLNLKHTTLDYVDIKIYITNTLESPVIIFSSNPAMSQDDIISYILFGEKASTLFENSGESTRVSMGSLVLGIGLKEIFDDASGLEVDTFNILTNEEGTLGYEIGTRLNKKIRVIYKNDTISSVILQYSLTPSTRVDVDIQDTGQGVSFIYLKDF